MPATASARRAARRRAVRRRRAVAVAILIALLMGAALAIGRPGGGSRARTARASAAEATGALAGARANSGLRPGSDPGVLPGPVLIADRDNNRLLEVSPAGRVLWRFPTAGDLPAGETFQLPDDAFFSPDGREVIATQEDDFVISVIDIARRRIVYRYGHPGVPGSEPGY